MFQILFVNNFLWNKWNNNIVHHIFDEECVFIRFYLVKYFQLVLPIIPSVLMWFVYTDLCFQYSWFLECVGYYKFRAWLFDALSAVERAKDLICIRFLYVVVKTCVRVDERGGGTSVLEFNLEPVLMVCRMGDVITRPIHLKSILNSQGPWYNKSFYNLCRWRNILDYINLRGREAVIYEKSVARFNLRTRL